jgi:hypothetical protein
MKNCYIIRVLVFLSMALMLVTAGCAKNKNTAGGSDASGLPQISSFADDIKDINLPPELEWNRKNSMSINTESFRGGIFNYRGRAEVMSLKDFMIASMQGNKWKLAGETTSKDIMLAFVKPNKTCMIVITDSMLGNTEMNLYVAIDKTTSGGAQPFGEAGSR